MTTLCAGCGLPEPADWCWEGRMECPADKPPRWLDPPLWVILRDIRRRLNKLEEKP